MNQTRPNPTAWSSSQVCDYAGCTFRQLDYWHNGLDLGKANGSGSRRWWTAREAWRIHQIARLAEAVEVFHPSAGLSLDVIRWVWEHIDHWVGTFVLELANGVQLVMPIDPPIDDLVPFVR